MFAQHTSGIPEDPATGSASGPLGAYLVRHLSTVEPEVTIVAPVSDHGPSLRLPCHTPFGTTTCGWCPAA